MIFSYKFNMGLRAEIVVKVLILMGCAILSVGLIMIKISENNMVNMKEAWGEALTLNLKKTIEDEMLKSEKPENDRIQRIVSSFAYASRVSSAIVLDGQQKIIAESYSGERGALFKDKDKIAYIQKNGLFIETKRRFQWTMAPFYESMSIYTPLLKNGKNSGSLVIVFGMSEVNDILTRTMRLMFIFLVCDSILILIFGNYMLTSVIFRPIKKFVKVAENISAGNLSQRVDYPGSNEIGQLSVSFNKMADSLEEHVGYLERINRELNETQRQLIRTEKLASIGRLSAGIAHEVGNPLGAILGYTDMLVKGVDDETTRIDYLKRIEHELRKIDTTIRELLDYSRLSTVNIKETDANDVVNEALSLLSHQKDFKGIQLEVDLEEALPHIMVDDNQLRQVLVNILLNAVDAMRDGGTIHISTGQIFEEDDWRKFSYRRKDDPDDTNFSRVRKTSVKNGKKMLKIAITDTGSGIKKENLESIFDPFYTTKDPGKGTGLGLSISQTIIASFIGRIEVKSEEGAGAAFTIFLPLEKVIRRKHGFLNRMKKANIDEQKNIDPAKSV